MTPPDALTRVQAKLDKLNIAKHNGIFGGDPANPAQLCSAQELWGFLTELAALRAKPCPHVQTSGEGTSYCTLAESSLPVIPRSALVEHKSGDVLKVWRDGENDFQSVDAPPYGLIRVRVVRASALEVRD